MAQSERAVTVVQQIGAGESGRLTVGFVSAALYRVLPPTLRAFRAQYPYIESRLLELPTNDQIKGLHSGELDIGFIHPPIPDDDDLAIRHICRDPLMVALPADHALANWGLVYGGSKLGLMGAMASAVLDLGGHVTGVIPQALVERELVQPGLSKLLTVHSMHERKAQMAELSSGFVALPGGIGTLEEIFEVFTWSQLGLHDKPCALLNVGGYYNRLLDFLDHIVEQRFLKDVHRDMLMVAETAKVLLDRFERYEAPKVDKYE